MIAWRRFQYIPPWELTNWGFLSYALRIEPGCDEWHNPSKFIVIPLLGMFVAFTGKFDRTGSVHIYSICNNEISGIVVSDCSICREIENIIEEDREQHQP